MSSTSGMSSDTSTNTRQHNTDMICPVHQACPMTRLPTQDNITQI